MTRQDARRLQAALGDWMARVHGEPRMGAEVHRARREFFGPTGAPARTDEAAIALAEQRFQEWFLLERESEVLGDVPAAASTRFVERGLHGSIVGVFRIRTILGDSVEATDLQELDADENVREVVLPREVARIGDVLVGRLYPRADGTWQPSAAVALYQPGAGLAAAFARDLDRLDLDRRLSQVELEHLLLRRGAPSPGEPGAAAHQPIEHLEADLERLLEAGGAESSVTEITQMLLAAERPGAVVGPLLDELAFETAIDLDRTRTLLLELWAALHAANGPPAAARPPAELPAALPGETLGEQLARRLDEGLAQRRDIGELFAELEALAGIEPEEADDDRNPFDDDEEEEEDEGEGEDEDAEAEPDQAGAEADDDERPAPRSAFGDLEPLVQEFLWEQDLADTSAAARTLRQWVQLQGSAAAPRTDVELVTAQDLMRVLLHSYLAAPPAERAAVVRSAFAALGTFYDWLATTQELDFRAVLAQCQGPMLDQLDRLAGLSRALSSVAVEGVAPPTLVRVVAADREGLIVRGDAIEDVRVAVPSATMNMLRAGDLLLGALQRTSHGPAFTGMVVALPGDVEALMS